MPGQFTALMRTIINGIGLPLAWPSVTSIALVKKTTAGAYASYLTLTEDWFAYRSVKEDSKGIKTPVFTLMIVDGYNTALTQANFDLLIGVAVKNKMYRKDKVYPPVGSDPAYWTIELQPTGEAWP